MQTKSVKFERQPQEETPVIGYEEEELKESEKNTKASKASNLRNPFQKNNFRRGNQ